MGSSAQNVTDSTGMGLFGSGNRSPVGYYSSCSTPRVPTRTSTRCTRPLAGTISVPMTAAPGPTAGTYTLTWAVRGAGRQLCLRRPDESSRRDHLDRAWSAAPPLPPRPSPRRPVRATISSKRGCAAPPTATCRTGRRPSRCVAGTGRCSTTTTGTPAYPPIPRSAPPPPPASRCGGRPRSAPRTRRSSRPPPSRTTPPAPRPSSTPPPHRARSTPSTSPPEPSSGATSGYGPDLFVAGRGGQHRLCRHRHLLEHRHPRPTRRPRRHHRAACNAPSSRTDDLRRARRRPGRQHRPRRLLRRLRYLRRQQRRPRMGRQRRRQHRRCLHTTLDVQRLEQQRHQPLQHRLMVPTRTRHRLDRTAPRRHGQQPTRRLRLRPRRPHRRKGLALPNRRSATTPTSVPAPPSAHPASTASRTASSTSTERTSTSTPSTSSTAQRSGSSTSKPTPAASPPKTNNRPPPSPSVASSSPTPATSSPSTRTPAPRCGDPRHRDGQYFSSPIVSGAPGDRVILIGDDANVEHAYRLDDGTPLFAYTTAGPIYSSTAIASGTILFGSNDGYLYAFG